MSSCSHCGKQRATLKRCSRCKQTSYCGAECQSAAWKGHKKLCVTLDDAFEKVHAANLREDWRGVIKLEGRMEEMMEVAPDDVCNEILDVFADAHRRAFNSTGSQDHSLSIVRLETRRAELLGKMQRFRDQGETLCRVADNLPGVGRRHEAEGYFQRARKIAEEHGFFSVECQSCLGLGNLALVRERKEEGLELLRNALLCVPLCVGNVTGMELNVLDSITNALFDTHAIDEVEPLVARYLEAGRAYSEAHGRPTLSELHSLYASARLHEVMCTWTPRPACGTPSHCSAHVFHQDR